MQQELKSEPYKNYDKDFVVIPTIEPVIRVPDLNSTQKPTRILRVFAWVLCILIILVLGMGLYAYGALRATSAPEILPVVVDIPKGSSLQTVTYTLQDHMLISSPLLFRMMMILSGEEHGVKTGEYTFNRPLTLSETIDKLVNAKYEYVPVKLTIHEGENAKEIAHAISVVFPKLIEADVYILLKDKEGKLFPETYIFAPFATIDEIIKTIDKEFDKRLAIFQSQIASSSRSEIEILTIASILEREVPQKEDMKIVAGIIYNRLSAGIPLQMDSTVGFITGKASLELVTDDLKIDSPYNTYAHKGLPPGPIGNPGDVAIEAALNPDTHTYLFFLSDKDGVNHYAKTYAEHLRNRRLYLGK